MFKSLSVCWACYALLLVSGSLYSQSPGGITRQSLWLKGDFFVASGQTRSLNFNPVTELGNNEQGVRLAGTVENLRRSTIFTVFQHPDLSQDNPVWKMSDGSADLQLTTREVSSISGKTNLSFGDSLAGIYQPGQPQALLSTYIRREKANPASSELSNEINVQFGSSGSFSQPGLAKGSIAELIVYETILKEKDIARIETYLGLKYGITLQRNYINSGGQTIWNRKNAKTYSNNIAGIGRDDQSALYQKQGTSASSSEQLTIGVGQIAQTNSINAGELNNKDYLIWGDNALPFRFDPNTKPKEDDMLLSDKKWLMESAGSSAHAISTQLSVNTKSLQSADVTGSGFYLVIDRSGIGDFNFKDCSYLLPDKITEEGIALFSGIKWDTDRSGKDVFTFAMNRKIREDAIDGSGKMISFSVYPNPITNGNYRAVIKLEKPADINVQIYDAHLRLIESRKMSGQNIYQVSGHLSAVSGVYIIKIMTSGKTYSKILIFQ